MRPQRRFLVPSGGGMATAYYIARITTIIYAQPFVLKASRTSAIDDAALTKAGGSIIGKIELTDRWIYRVDAANAVLNAVAALNGVTRLPTALLNAPLSDLTANQRTAIRDELLDQGYSLQAVNDQFPNLAQATLKQVLRYMTRTRRLPTWDDFNGGILLNGDEIACVPSIDEIEART